MSNLPKNPGFVWSPTRDAVFSACPLEYYYAYYKAWNGWSIDSEEGRREAYACKNLTSLPSVFNAAFRDAVASVFRSVRDNRTKMMSTEAAVTFVKERVRSRLNEAYRMRRDYRGWLDDPKRGGILMEGVYGSSLDEPVKETRKKIAAIGNLAETRTFREFFSEFGKGSSFGKVLEVSENPFKTGLGSFEMFGIRVMTGVDLLYKRNDGVYVASNWKTSGEKASDAISAEAVAAYVSLRYGVPLGKIRVRNEYLLEGTVSEFVPNLDNMKAFAWYVEASAEAMKSFVIGGDTGSNVPVDEEEFAKASENPSCAWCRYRGICIKHAAENEEFFDGMREFAYIPREKMEKKNVWELSAWARKHACV